MSAQGSDWYRSVSAPDVAQDGAYPACTGSELCPRSWINGVASGPAAVVAYGDVETLGGRHAVLWVSQRATAEP